MSLFFALISILIFILGFTYYKDSIFMGLLFQVSAVIGIFFTFVLFKGAIEISRTIEVQKGGILITYPFRKGTLIKWGDIQEVSIGYYHGNGHGVIGDDPKACIFFIKKGEEKTSIGFWNINHVFGVFYLPYTSELVSELKENCPITVVDKRDTLLYKRWRDKDKKR